MRLIDADEYAKEMKRRQDAVSASIEHPIADRYYTDKEHWEGVMLAFVEAKLTLDKMPTVEKHGRFVMDEYPHDGDVRCSVCLKAINQMHERNHKLLNALTGGKWYTFYRYCPHCGAKMDLEETP